MIDLSRLSAPELNTYNFISFGGSAAVAPADIKNNPTANEPRTVAQFTRMSSSLFRCSFLSGPQLVLSQIPTAVQVPSLRWPTKMRMADRAELYFRWPCSD